MATLPDALPVFDHSVNLSTAPRVWAIAAIHGQAEILARLHDAVGARFVPGDRLVYLGNVLGGGDVAGTLAELLRFRRSVLALPPLYLPEDVVFLRGRQEEMWHKLLQIHFAPKPKDLLTWMLSRGVDATLAAYGGDRDQGFAAAAEGMVALTRWTARLKAAMQAVPGHQPWFADLRRYAHTGPGGVLFVHAGLDPTRPLAEQRDAFWWESGAFAGAAGGYAGFARIVRGFDPDGGGWREDGAALTIDSGCGRGGGLTAVCFAPSGEILDRVDAAAPAA
ncbi:MAG: hypothetical protein HQ481_00445 [Alphaproteobacteria bacterium]|nr:hypothetical protein [Alphaproteobacteria bacterium]